MKNLTSAHLLPPQAHTGLSASALHLIALLGDFQFNESTNVGELTKKTAG